MTSSGLPIEDCIDELRAALHDSPNRAGPNSAGPNNAVLQAEPGAGKTTVVPLRLLDEPFLADGHERILMLEPRRLATRAAARRSAELLGEPVGQTVGYVTRDDRKTSDRTRIEVVTEGILTRRIQRDPELSGIGLVIFDEFHERSLQADLGLALSLDVQRSIRPDLRILVMSATIDTDAVSTLLDDAPVIRAPGRTHPIDMRWRPRPDRQHLEPAVADAVKVALREPGDVLVFLPGAAAIDRTARLLNGVTSPDGRPVDVRRLFGALPPAEQDAAVAPSDPTRRKVVLSTDIAETSLTVLGVRTVVDSGQVREPRFDPRTGMTRLVTVANSRASADQRAGRAGRTEAGAAIRLWSKIEHGARPPFAKPEISRVDVAGLLLELQAWGVNDPAEVALLDRPSDAAVAEGRTLLTQLGALDDEGHLTSLGRAMSNLPLHPRLARMVLVGDDMGLGPLACAIAALLEDRDILRGQPGEIPTDLAVRIDLLSGAKRDHPNVHRGGLQRAKQQSRDLRRRAKVSGELHPAHGALAGGLLALAYPDRIAQQRTTAGGSQAGQTGRYRMRNGSGAQLNRHDSLANEDMLVVADLDGKRNDARIRLAAAISKEDVELANHDDITEDEILVWDNDRNDLVARAERRLGSLRLSVIERQPESGERTQAALLRQVSDTSLAVLDWNDAATELRTRVGFARSVQPEAWPDLSSKALLGSLDGWLAPFLDKATGRRHLEAVDLTTAFWNHIGYHRQAELDELAPTMLEIANGRPRPIDYSREHPTVRARVQQMFGTTTHPTIARGQVPIVVELLSPADRPIQITSDLPGFWAGSWLEVRKDLAGRYPKHDWPIKPNG